MSITIDLVTDLEVKIRDAAKREGVDPNTYVMNVLEHHLYKQTITVAEAEAQLLQQINLGLSENTWQRYNELREKLQHKTLQADEQQALIDITSQIEAANVRRIEALMKLAKLRNTTLDALIDELGLRPAAYVS